MAYEITISDPDGSLEATFIPEVGMVNSSLRHRGEELFDPVGGLAKYVEQGSVFANCLLYPWANRLRSWEFELGGEQIRLDPDSPLTHRDGATGTPIHGLLGASPHWTVTDADRSTLTAELDFAAVPEYMAAFPFPHLVRYTATAEDSALRIDITVIPSGDRAVPVSFGFHPYLTLPGSDRRGWQVAIPAARQALVDERMIPTGDTAEIVPGELDGPLHDRTFDTNYDELRDGSQSVFSVADDRRRISVELHRGYPVGQVYTPQNAQFICFEPMVAPVDALVSGDRLPWVAPGEEFSASFSIAAH